MSEQVESMGHAEEVRMASPDSVPKPAKTARPGEGMIVVGHLLIWPGLILIAVAYALDTSVETASTYVDGVGVIGGGEVTNLARQQKQLLLALLGGLAFIAGVVLAGFGAVVKQLAARSTSDSAEP